MNISATMHTELKTLGLPHDERMIDQFARYCTLLQEWNQKFNLTAVDDESGILYRHFLDSLALTRCMDLKSVKTLADIGSGAGFPGIPLKIVFPHLRLTLIEATQKKTVFLEEVVRQLGLSQVSVLWGRAEQKPKGQTYDVVTARAVAKLPVLLTQVWRLLNPQGRFVAYKQEAIDEELSLSAPTLKQHRGRLISKHTVDLFDGKETIKRCLLVFGR
jgi:16S rRNA (guanine527-N7)-methyltransferase